jgi:2-polyprenyl-3-methyl-5-hydroxy-6-metoxy-1,4-benzoquinol methylase
MDKTPVSRETQMSSNLKGISTMTQNKYVIEGGQKGKERLQLLSHVLQPTTAQLFDRVKLGAGMRVLDVGCGGGDVTLDMARRVGEHGHVTGLDFDATILELACRDAKMAGLCNVEFRHADALYLDEPPVYDCVYARFLLTHLVEPGRGLAGMIRTAKPGGLVVVEDIDFSGYFCYPNCAAFDRYLDLYAKVVHLKGGDPDIGLKLADMFLQAGLAEVGIQVVQPVHREGEGKRIAQITLERIGDAVKAAGLVSAKEFTATVAELAEFTVRTDTIISLPRVFQVWGVRNVYKASS